MSSPSEAKLTRRSFLRAAATVAASLPILAACAPTETKPTPAPEPTRAAATAMPQPTKAATVPAPTVKEPVKISMWTWYTEQQDEFPKLIDEFNKSQSGIVAESRIYNLDEYLKLIQAALAAGTPPDILGPHVHAIEYGLAGQTVDLKESLGEEFLSQFFPSTRRQFTAQGKQFAIGWMAQTFGFFYNPPLFEKAGVAAVPETWDDLMGLAPKFKAVGLIPWAFNNAEKWLGCDFMLPLITQATDNPDLVYDLDEHTKEGVSWNSKPVIDALTMVERLVKSGIFEDGVNGTNWDQATALFYSGKAAMFFAGSWVPQGIKQNASPEFARTYRVFRTPAWAPGKRHWCGNQAGAALAVAAKGHVAEACQFLKFTYEPDRYSRIMNNSLSMPSTMAAAAKVEDPIMKEMTSWLSDGAPHILFGAGSWDAVSNAVQGITGLVLSPEQAAAQIEQDVQTARKR